MISGLQFCQRAVGNVQEVSWCGVRRIDTAGGLRLFCDDSHLGVVTRIVPRLVAGTDFCP